MTFDDILAQVITLLQRQGRVSYPALHIAPCGRTLQPSPLDQGPARGALEAYVPRLITSPSSEMTP